MTSMWVDDETRVEVHVGRRPVRGADGRFESPIAVAVLTEDEAAAGRIRIHLNDGLIWDGDPTTDEKPGAKFETEWSDVHVPEAIAEAVWTYFEGGHRFSRFEGTLIAAMLAADDQNKERLGYAFPAYARAIGLWQSSKDELRAAAGRF